MKRIFLNWAKLCMVAAILVALCISGCNNSSDGIDIGGNLENNGNTDDGSVENGNPDNIQNPDLDPEQKTCTLYFYPNAPEGTPEAETLEPKTVTVNVGSYYTLPQEPVFSVEGYYFIGWAESLEYTYYTHNPGEEIWIPTELNIPDTYTLYAVWGDTTYTNGLRIYKNIVVGYVQDELPADVVIPDGVTAIGWKAFCNFDNPCQIKSVTIPGSVQHIELEAFSYCPNLEKVVIKEGQLTEIGGYFIFENCESLKSVELPDNVKTIGKLAFAGCQNLESVTMNGVERIEEMAFGGLTSVHLPNSLKFIGDEAFWGCNFESITIPDSVDVENIGKGVFRYCKKLKKVVLPDSWNEIKDYMFEYCESLTDINFLPSALKIIGEAAFASCGLTEVIIPDGVTEIGNYAFEECSNLTEAVIPDGVTEIKDGAFSYCKNLSKVKIPDSVKIIRERAFYNSPLSEIIIPDNATVEDNAFSVSTNLRTISLPASVLNAGVKFWDIFIDWAFSTSNTNYCPELKIPIIDDRFSDCRNIDIILRDGTTRIPKDFFDDDMYIYPYIYKSIRIPDGVETIEEYAFFGAYFDSGIELPDSVKVIKDKGMRGCRFAGKLPSKLEYIGSYAFAGYSGESVTIPGSVKFFDEFAFYDSNLKSVVIEPGVTEIPGGTFAAYNGKVTGVLEKIEIPNTVTKIGASAFFYQPNLTDVKIPDSVKTIEWDAFVGCKNLNAQVTGEWQRVNKDDKTNVVDSKAPSGNNLYLYSNWNWYKK
ncbi:MAG: leucine-rich repeat domain-containing protein [Treponema sp.]|nr:leucine-rich repeat domain-containing protein [Treponema sp.]